MALTRLGATTQIARVDGGNNDADQLSAAQDALSYTIDKWNRTNWTWLFRDNSAAPIDITSGTADYALPTTIRTRGEHSVRLLSRNRTLIHTEMRNVDRVIRNQSVVGLTTHYTAFNIAGFDPAAQTGNIRLIRTPDYTQSADLVVRFYELLLLPALDATEIDIPDQYRDVLVAMGRSRYLGEKNTEGGKLAYWDAKATQMFREMKEDDHGTHNDDEPRLKSQTEWGFSYGSEDLLHDLGIS